MGNIEAIEDRNEEEEKEHERQQDEEEVEECFRQELPEIEDEEFDLIERIGSYGYSTKSN